MKKTTVILLLTLISNSYSQCWKDLSTGYGHAVGIKYDGTMWVWGHLGDVYSSNIPIQVRNENNWKSVATNSACLAIKLDGTLWGWGPNWYRELGVDNEAVEVDYPEQVGISNNWAKVFCGISHTIGIKTDGTLWAWGDNTNGQVGNGSTIQVNTPIQIGNQNDWTVAAGGINFTMAIKTDGTLWGWGNNSRGQLGDGTTEDKYVPVQIGSDSNWQSVSSGDSFTIALRNDGTLWGWGYNPDGRLGTNSSFDVLIPTQIGSATDWEYISAGYRYTMAIKTNGTLWACGENYYGQLGGNLNQEPIYSLVPIGNSNDWQTVSARNDFSVGLKTDGVVWSTGENFTGQLGNGNYVSSTDFNPINCPVLSTSDDLKSGQFLIYPNPAAEILNIISPNNDLITSAKIIDVLGKILYQKTGNILKINIENLQKGLFILELSSKDKIQKIKFSKQ